ncbi:FAD-dependent monooxygenase [Allonocardiopsis opalescens]|uniref:2-polyprenyl-6-methoxyphenol hydroxylase-like FAD-dependent oxidoreductase n=1 Tax=Allonocardiopsis opalescens TaxID=1144618 RepID=A0A2T0PPT0_9ACTN|nr:FAD-dependent monooxygenase [Allonocardiopsis opalescens]PRX90910.1 2-polyprenyl-6-methoxyphenol hydroxylase-like FAD-dependent oxidoreductase [Allonocardiopsis opalescens]
MADSVLIVGAGPVGMLLACELLQQGVPVRIVDGARGHSAHSRATIMWPRLLELLHRTGLTERIVAAGHRVEGVSYFSGGRPLGTAWLSRMTDTPYPFAVGIAQSATEDIMEQRLTELGGKIERGTRLTALRGVEGGRQLAVLESPDGSAEEVSTPWLVGADGAHSTVRKLLDIPFEGEQLDVSFAITDAEVRGDMPMNVVSYCYTPVGSLALGPLGPTVSRVAVSVPHPEDDTPPTREFFQSIVDERAPGRNVLGELRFSTVFRVNARIAARFRGQRALLVGDAAHIMSPAGAQGMNTGLQDSANLGWRLGGLMRGAFTEDVLAGYERERRHGAHAVSRSTARQTRWGFFRKPAQIALRDIVFRTATATGMVQRAIVPLIAQTDVRYPVVDTEGTTRKGPVPGGRLPVLPQPSGAPVPALAREGEWPRVSGDGLTVLLWPGRSRDAGWSRTAAEVRASVPEAAVVEVRPGYAPIAGVLGGAAALAVVRPDGHLLATLPAPDRAYLPRVLAALRLRPEPVAAPLEAATPPPAAEAEAGASAHQG